MSGAAFRTLAGIPPSMASTKDSILVIIDAQNEYADGALAVSNIATSRPAITGLLKKYRDAGGKIIHVVHSVPAGTPVFTPGTPLEKEFEELTPANGEAVVVKNFPGSFAETDLDEKIKATGLQKLVLVGYMAHVCVSTTAREAHQKGYDVLVAEDAIGDRDIPGAKGDELTRTVLAELGDFFGTVIKSADVQ